MDTLKIRYHNQICTILCENSDFQLFLEELEEKLKNSFFHGKRSFEAFFSFPFILDEEQLIILSDICDQNDTIILGLLMPLKKEEELNVKAYEFYNGNIYILHGSHVYIGNIEKDVHVICDGDLYVVGKVLGKVDLLYRDLKLSASSFSQARIRIFDSRFQNVTNLLPSSVYYDDKEGLKVH